LNEDFTLSLLNRYECLLNPEGTVEKYSLEGKVIAKNHSPTKSLKELTVFLVVPDKNISTEVRLEDLSPGSSHEKDLMSVKLNPKEDCLPVIVTETISTLEDFQENYRVVYPNSQNPVWYRLTVKNQGQTVVSKIRLTKNVESLSNINQNQTKVETGKLSLGKNALIWDIDKLEAGKQIELTFAAKISTSLMEAPFNEGTSLVYELPSTKENNLMWKIHNLQIPKPVDIDLRVYKEVQASQPGPRWSCQVALKNIMDWNLTINKISVKEGDRSLPVFEYSLEKGSSPIVLNAHQAWQSEIWRLEQELKPALSVLYESEVLPNLTEQISYNVVIPESPFELAKISASRAIISVELTSPTSVKVMFESILKNSGTATVNDLEIIHQFPNSVELPALSEVSLILRGVPVSKNNFEINVAANEELPNVNLFRVIIRNMRDSIGGFRGGEEIHVNFPLYLKVNLENDILNFPTFFNALVRANAPLIEDTVADRTITGVQVKRRAEVLQVKSAPTATAFEAQVIGKFSSLAVEAYNARKYEDALAYCEQILAVAQKTEDKVILQNFANIITKLKEIIRRNEGKK